MLLGYTNNGEQLESGSGGLNGGDGIGGEGGVQLKKGPWTATEDAILSEYVRKHGEGNWNAVQRNTGLARCGKSCRLRWANHLRPNLKKGAFFPEEERLIVELHAQLGNKWARMASQLPGRTDNEIKNYWNTRVKRCHRQGLPLYPPEIQHQRQHQQSSHSHHSSHSQSQPSTPTSSFSFPITPTGHHHQHHHRSHSLHHFPPPCYSHSPTPSLPPTPPPVSPGLQSPHQPAYPTLTLFDTNNNNNATTNNISSAFNMPRTPPLLQNPPRLKRFHSDTSISTFAANNNNNNNNNNSINSSNNFQGSTSFTIPFSPFLRSPSSPSLLTSPTSNCNASAFSSAASKLLSLPSFSTLPVSFSNPNTSTMFRNPDEKDSFLTSTGSVFNLKPELPSSQLLSSFPNENTAEIAFENEKLSVSNIGSGLLEDLLEQAHAGNYGESSRRVNEDKSDFSGFNPWSDSSSMNLSSELKPKEEKGDQINMHEDISKLLNVDHSMQVPEWYTDSGEASNCQSSVVTYDNLGLEMQQLASIFRVDSTTDPGSCSYDNLPGNG